MDFLVHNISDTQTEEILESNGNKVFLLPKITPNNFISIYKELDSLFKNNKYDIIHCNMPNMAFVYFYFAKKYNIKVRILHSHQNKYSDNILHSIRNYPLVLLGKNMATNRIACSNLAGSFLFKKEKFDIVNNAIDVKKFVYNSETRQIIRSKLGIQNKFVVGNIGRLTAQKNQIFLIEVFNEIYKMNKDSVLLIIGTGKLEKQLKAKVKKLNLEQNVFFIKETNNINEYYQAMDVFVLPSLYEGVGIVNIEAQASGLKTIVSDVVPKEANIVEENFITISLNKPSKCWASEILKFNNNYKRRDYSEIVVQKGYDIHEQAEKLINLYKEYIKENVNEDRDF